MAGDEIEGSLRRALKIQNQRRARQKERTGASKPNQDRGICLSQVLSSEET